MREKHSKDDDWEKKMNRKEMIADKKKNAQTKRKK